MAFKMRMGKLSMDNTPIYQVDLDGDVMGEAHNNGSILVDKNLSSEVREDAIRHEKVHLDQMKRGDLAYDDDKVYWKGKEYPREKMEEGNRNLPWEQEAWKANKLNYS
jgi:hypothetical protein